MDDGIIEQMTFFIDQHPTFNGSTMEALIEVYAETGELSEGQEQAIMNVYEKWRVKEFCEKNHKIVKIRSLARKQYEDES